MMMPAARRGGVCNQQDSTSNPGTVFAVGLTLESLSTHTVDESGQRAFVTQNPLKLLRKVLPVL